MYRVVTPEGETLAKFGNISNARRFARSNLPCMPWFDVLVNFNYKDQKVPVHAVMQSNDRVAAKFGGLNAWDTAILVVLHGNSDDSDGLTAGHVGRDLKMPMTEDGYVEGEGWCPGIDFDPYDRDEMEIMEHIFEGERLSAQARLERENSFLRGQLEQANERITELEGA